MRIVPLLLALSSLGPWAISAQGTSTVRPARWILSYAGGAGSLQYSVDDFVRLIAAVDSTGRPTTWLSTGIVFAVLKTRSGNHFATWAGTPFASGADWEAYASEMFKPGGVLQRLDSATALVGGVLGQPRTLQVVMVTLYPDARAESVSVFGSTYHFTNSAEEARASAAYVHVIAARFDSSHFANLQLRGFYWLHEEIHGHEEQVVPLIAKAVHAEGKEFFWVPFYTAWGVESWKQWGFDEAWLQPNYFFNLKVAESRLDSSVARARRLGMGIELEFDGRAYSKPSYYDRLDAYLRVLGQAPDLQSRGVLVYEGGGGLVSLSRSRVKRDQGLYQRFVAAFAPDREQARTSEN